ncbi:P2Y purinoceptor 3-like [Pempheris klunzingeri]|uniref:P2Y purinoceptor 3-like n=1 Tax=Pempheris klunzingeri TaxID=3127111 RepID=UPI003980128A
MENFWGNGTVDHNNTSDDLDKLARYLLPTVVIVQPLGLPTNALVLRLLLAKPGICSTSDIFILNLTLFNLLFCMMIVIEYIRFLFVWTVESASFLAFALNQTGGPLLLTCLALNRYMAVCHPLLFLQLKDPKVRLSMCFAVSAITAACCFLVKYLTFGWNMVSVLLVFDIVIISTCNILILKSLRQSGPNTKAVHPVKMRALKIVLTTLVLVNFHYTPSLVEYLLRNCGPVYFRPFSVFTSVASALLSTGTFMQPLSYLIRTKQLHKMRCACGSAAETKTEATGQSGPS